MHISDGALSTEVMAVTNVVATAAVGWCIKKMHYRSIPLTGLLAAAFFLASFIHIKLGPASIHLLLSGLIGLLLGWQALTALAVALFLQAVLLGFGGITSLGANILIMGLPAVGVYALFGRQLQRSCPLRRGVMVGAIAGALAVVSACLLMAMILWLSDPQAYRWAIKAMVVGHLPLLLIEALVTGAGIGFLLKVKPELFTNELQKDAQIA